MKITIDKNSGYCFGVEYAIDMAENELDKGETLYCLGDIVHNSMEVKRLAAKGLIVIDNQELANMWMRTPQRGLWFTGGSFSQCRMYSRYLAMQIKAQEIGLV